jgi:hypothetical protein
VSQFWYRVHVITPLDLIAEGFHAVTELHTSIEER